MGFLKLFSKTNAALQRLPAGSLTVDRTGKVVTTTVASSYPPQLLQEISTEVLRIYNDWLHDFCRTSPHRLIGLANIPNHDMDVAFPRVQRLLRARLGVADGSPALAFLADQEFYRMPGGVVVPHGHLFEEVNRTAAGRSLVRRPDGVEVVNLPFGSRFFLDVIAPVKAEQPLIDLVHPLSSFILWGLAFDLRFTLRVIGRMLRFLLRTRLNVARLRAAGLVRTLQVLFEEVAMFDNLERRASRLLRSAADIRALIVGHTHFAKVRRFPRDKLYVNTGTWVKIVSLDLRDLGTRNYLTYALVEYPESGAPSVRLMRWRGVPRSYEEIVT